MNLLRSLSLVALIASAGSAQALALTEDFEAEFPAWESGWFGTQSDARNYYCAGALGCTDRGNNPDGLWIASTAGQVNPVVVNFSGALAAGLSSFKLDVAAFSTTTLSAWDVDGVEIFSEAVTLTSGAFSDPGVYASYTITSTNGIGGFAFSGSAAGNTSVDNLVAITSAVPEPATALLLLAGAAGLALRARRA